MPYPTVRLSKFANQLWSHRWARRDDLVSLIIEALQNPAYSGVYNGTAPNPVRMSELCSSLGASVACLRQSELAMAKRTDMQ